LALQLTTLGIQIRIFATSKEWNRWLIRNHNRLQGVWLRFYKKDSSTPTVSYDEALEEALCYGWIDGQLKPYEKKSWLRKFIPCRQKSLWSKHNIEHVHRLVKAGRMKTTGLKEVETAKTDGRWKNAYDPGSMIPMPTDFLQKLSNLKKANTYTIAWCLQTANRSETREKRIEAILAMLAKVEKLHD
jgi:uncharacterized protein YdeI (YjbR/CyaY-like superfamily)